MGEIEQFISSTFSILVNDFYIKNQLLSNSKLQMRAEELGRLCYPNPLLLLICCFKTKRLPMKSSQEIKSKFEINAKPPRIFLMSRSY